MNKFKIAAFLSFLILTTGASSATAQSPYEGLQVGLPTINATSISVTTEQSSFEDDQGETQTNELALVAFQNFSTSDGFSSDRFGVWFGRGYETTQHFIQFRPTIDENLANIPGLTEDLFLGIDTASENLDLPDLDSFSDELRRALLTVIAQLPIILENNTQLELGEAEPDKTIWDLNAIIIAAQQVQDLVFGTSTATVANDVMREGAIFSTSQPSSQSFLRFFNSGSTAGSVTVTLSDNATGQQLGEWTSPSIAAGTAVQHFIGNIEDDAGETFDKPSFYSIGVTSDFSGYLQHVLWKPADGTLTNLSTCNSGVTADPVNLNNVHTSVLDGNYPSSVVVHNNGTSATTVTLGIYDATDGTQLGTFQTESISAGGHVILPVAEIEAGAALSPASNQFHYIIKTESVLTGYLQHLVNNIQAGVITDMTTVCSFDSALTVAASTPLRSGAVFSGAQPESQSFLRFQNSNQFDGIAKVTLYDAATGAEAGQWTSPAIPGGSAAQYSIASIEADAQVLSPKPDFYAVSAQSQFDGSFQNVLWRSTDGTLTNLSTCSAGVGSNGKRLSYVHSTLLDANYPSTLHILNTGPAGAPVTLLISDARDGTLLGSYTTPTIPANGQLNLRVADIESGAGIEPSAGMFQYVIEAGSVFSGYFQHTVNNVGAGVVTDMSGNCAMAIGPVTNQGGPAFEIQAFQFYVQYNYPDGPTLTEFGLEHSKSLFQEYRDLGFNTVSLGWGVPFDVRSGRIAASFINNSDGACGNSHFSTLQELEQLIDAAQELDLSVILKPAAQTQESTGSNGSCMDNINEHSVADFSSFNVDTFLSDWADYLSTVAPMAEEQGVSMFAVGTESSGYDSDEYRAEWQDVIESVRSSYSGQVTYNAFGNPSGVGFWDLVDVIGIDVYYGLTSKTDPTYADALAGWFSNTVISPEISPDGSGTPVNLVAALHNLSAQYDKPLYFGEFGAQAIEGLLNDPSGASPEDPVRNNEHQAWLYESMFQALGGVNGEGWFLGISYFGALPGDTLQSDTETFAEDLENFITTYDIRGKPAADVVADWFLPAP